MRRFHLIIALIVALLGAVVAIAIVKGPDPKRGLDLQGGLEVVFEAEAPPGEEVTSDGLDRAIEIMRKRVDAFGVAEPEIRKQGDDQIVVELPGAQSTDRAAERIGSTAQLQFYDLEGDLVAPSLDENGFPVAAPRLYPLLQAMQQDATEGAPTAWYLYDENKNLIAGPAPTEQDIRDEFPDGELPEGSELLSVPSDRIVLTCGPDAVVCPGVTESPPTRTYYYVFDYDPGNAESPVPEMTGEDLELDGTRADFDPQTGQPVVLMRFTDGGEQKFEDITRELAIRGKTLTGRFGSDTPVLQHFAIVLDNEIVSWPSIDFEQYPDGISGTNGAQITGLDSPQEAKDLATVLQTGALPYTFRQVDRTDISATLGQDSLREALIAAIGGLLAVGLFLLVVYRFLGIVAILGLAIYGALLYGVLLLFDVTLTLPGFAGLILTIGVAADANIVIFERIKEEVRAGRSVRAAVTTGYRKGFATIVDANVVTMITAFVLFAVGTGGPKGFALMLLIGTLLSMFTAVAATRALLGLLSGFRWFDNPRFMGASGMKIPRWQRIDFVGKRRLWFALSGVVVLVSVVSLGVRGLNTGIDFDGGTQVTFDTAQPVSIEQVREVASGTIPSSAVVQGRGDSQGDAFSSFSIRTEALSPDEQAALRSALEDDVQAEALGVRNVSGSFSSQILRGAILAICVSLALIVIYVSIRFQWKFAVPVLVALVHDVFITLGVYSLTGLEVTTSTVAAVLTILGYSIYDTIIIFDRVRENIPLMRRSSFAAIANVSLWETIRRSLATTFITLLPILSLLFFGGATLQDFAFALLVGIVSGAYSTIFIATPLLAVIKEREPEYARLKGQDHGEAEKSLEPVEAPVAAGAAPERRVRRRAGRSASTVPAAVQGTEVVEEIPEGSEALAAEAAELLAEEAAEQAADDEGDGGATPASDAAARPADAAARREERRRRRRARPHGRAR